MARIQSPVCLPVCLPACLSVCPLVCLISRLQPNCINGPGSNTTSERKKPEHWCCNGDAASSGNRDNGNAASPLSPASQLPQHDHCLHYHWPTLVMETMVTRPKNLLPQGISFHRMLNKAGGVLILGGTNFGLVRATYDFTVHSVFLS